AQVVAILCVLDVGGVVVCESVLSREFEDRIAGALEPGSQYLPRGLVCVRAAVDPGGVPGAEVSIPEGCEPHWSFLGGGVASGREFPFFVRLYCAAGLGGAVAIDLGGNANDLRAGVWVVGQDFSL